MGGSYNPGILKKSFGPQPKRLKKGSSQSPIALRLAGLVQFGLLSMVVLALIGLVSISEGVHPVLAQSMDEMSEPYGSPPTRPTRVRVAILNTIPNSFHSQRIAILLNDHRKKSLEKQLGMRLEMVNVSQTEPHPYRGTIIYYRKGYLAPALLIAKAIPGDQLVEPMKRKSLEKEGVDVEILVGKDAR